MSAVDLRTMNEARVIRLFWMCGWKSVTVREGRKDGFMEVAER